MARLGQAQVLKHKVQNFQAGFLNQGVRMSWTKLESQLSIFRHYIFRRKKKKRSLITVTGQELIFMAYYIDRKSNKWALIKV